MAETRAVLPARRGMALLAVMLVIAAAGTMLVAYQLHVRQRVQISRNVSARLEADWLAERCAARLRAAMHEALADSVNGDSRADVVWRHLRENLRGRSALLALPCEWMLEPAGLRINVNAADEPTLMRALALGGVRGNAVLAATHAALDWIDGDDVPRPAGAERSWYENEGLVPPGNRAFESVRELSLVRGLDAAVTVGELLDVVDDPIDALHAPENVLRLMPGMSEQLLARIVEHRERLGALPPIEELLRGLTPEAQATAASSLGTLRRLYAREPVAWMVDVYARAPRSSVVSRVRQRLTRAGTRVVVQQEWRAWA